MNSQKIDHPVKSNRLQKANLLRYILVVGGLLLIASLLMGAQCFSTCSTGSYYKTPFSNVTPRVAPDAVNAQALNVWIDISATGVYSPALTNKSGVFDWLNSSTADEVQGLPSYLDELAEKGYLAIRVPHAPPTYTTSSLIPGILPWNPNAIEFTYYMPPDAPAATTVPITVTRIMTHENIVNALYPIDDGRSHWEVWWLENTELSIPPDTFRLKDEWPRPIEVTFSIDFVDAGAADCAGCIVEVLLYNGYNFIGPSQAPLVIEGAPVPVDNPSAVFDQGCTGMAATYLEHMQPSVPFSLTHWLANYDTVPHTYTVTATSSQGWDYAFYYGPADQPLQRASGVPFTVTVDPGQPGDWPPPPCINITAAYTPTITLADSIRESYQITAVSVDNPDVQASTVSVALAPGYQLQEGTEFKLYLPLVTSQYP